MRKLFLDDSRKAPDFTWDVVRTCEEFVAYIELHGVPDFISFDHDLLFDDLLPRRLIDIEVKRLSQK